MREPTDESAEFWRERAARLKSLARRAGVGGGVEDGTSARERERVKDFDYDANANDDADDDDAWMPSTRGVSTVSGWRVRACPTMVTSTSTNGSRAGVASWTGGSNSNAKTSKGRSVESALDDARSIEAGRAG